MVRKRITSKLLRQTAAVALILLNSSAVKADDLSGAIETGGTVNVDGADTFIVDNTNDGDPATAIIFNDDATNGVDSLTISSDGNDADDTGQIGSITVLDDNGTNTLNINDATDGVDGGDGGSSFLFHILGDINGNVNTDANDLRVLLSSRVLNNGGVILDDNGDVRVAISGNVDLGTGGFVIDSDFDQTDVLELLFNGIGTQTISGTIDAAAGRAGTGVLLIGEGGATNAIFNSEIGGTEALDLISIEGGATATFKSDVTVRGDNGAALGFEGFLATGDVIIDTSDRAVTIEDTNGDITINGTLTATGANNAGIISDSDLSIQNDILAALSGGSNLFLQGNDSLLIGTTNDIQITAGNQIVLGSDVTIGGVGRENVISIQKTQDFNPETTAVIDATGDVVSVVGNLKVMIDPSSLPLTLGSTVTVIDSDTNAGTSYATLVTNGSIVFVDTAVLNLENAGSDAQDLKFSVSLKENPDGATTLTSKIIRQAISASSPNADLEALSSLLSLTSGNINDAGAALVGDPTGGAMTTRVIASNMILGFDLVSSRLTDLRRAQAENHHDGALMRQSWVRGFGFFADQEVTDGIEGYDADTSGIVMGTDKVLENNMRFGLNASYSFTSVNASGPGNRNADIDSYRIGLYGGQFFDNFYLEGQASYSYNDIETSRTIVFPGLNRRAVADADGHEFGFRLGTGLPIAFQPGHEITPHLNFQYIHSSVSSYLEKGAGALNVRVDNEDIDIAELAIGATYSTDIHADDNILTLQFRAAAAYDFIGENAISNQQFAGVGDGFIIEGADVQKFSVRFGAGLEWKAMDNNWDFSLNYDGKVKSDFFTHGVRLAAKYQY